MRISLFGQRFGQPSGIRLLMEDLGAALADGRDLLLLGGGNPAHIPAMQDVLRTRLRTLADDPRAFARMVGDYDAPQGEHDFIVALARLLSREYGWPLTSRNIVLTHGSQSAFFLLFNLFAGPHADGTTKRVLLPMAPEYIGYGDVGLTAGLVSACRPVVELLPDHLFKYRLDPAALDIGDDIAALCVSRPTNPTGNVLTDAEMQILARRAHARGVPLIVDGANGTPFPNILYTDANPFWDNDTILCLSLSKLGLPAVRTGIVIAAEPVIDALAGLNAILHLATGSLGAALTTEMVRTGDILQLSREVIRPYYQAKADAALGVLHRQLAGLDYRIHKPEGAIFLWLWFPDLPVSSQQLYERLKARGVLVLPGQHFFPGLTGEWRHRHECLRMSYAQDDAVVAKGITLIAEEVRRACDERPAAGASRTAVVPGP